MNYIMQLIQFKKRKMIRQLTANAILLYHILLEYSNEIGFPKSFTAANSALQARSSLSRQKIQQARSLLQEDGYITYITGSGNQCGTYSLTDLTINYEPQSDLNSEPQSDTQSDTQSDIDPQTDTQNDTQTDPQFGTQTVHKSSTLTKQNRNKTKQNKKDTLCEKENLLFFEVFWKAYPKKQAKSDALKVFLKLSPDKELLDRMLDAIELFCRTDSWKQDKGRYIPLPATWLNGKRWEDETIILKLSTMSDGTGGCPY